MSSLFLIFLSGLVVVLLFQLRNVLKSYDEQNDQDHTPKPKNPFIRPPSTTDMPHSNSSKEQKKIPSSNSVIDGTATEYPSFINTSSSVQESLEHLKTHINFDPYDFIDKANMALKMTFEALEKGDNSILEMLLSSDLFQKIQSRPIKKFHLIELSPAFIEEIHVTETHANLTLDVTLTMQPHESSEISTICSIDFQKELSQTTTIWLMTRISPLFD